MNDKIPDDVILSLDEFCGVVRSAPKMRFGSPPEVAEAMFKQFVRDRSEKYLTILQKKDPVKAIMFGEIKHEMALENWKNLLALFKFNITHAAGLKKQGITIELKGPTNDR